MSMILKVHWMTSNLIILAACNAVQLVKHICNINTRGFSGIATAY